MLRHILEGRSIGILHLTSLSILLNLRSTSSHLLISRCFYSCIDSLGILEGRILGLGCTHRTSNRRLSSAPIPISSWYILLLSSTRLSCLIMLHLLLSPEVFHKILGLGMLLRTLLLLLSPVFLFLGTQRSPLILSLLVHSIKGSDSSSSSIHTHQPFYISRL